MSRVTISTIVVIIGPAMSAGSSFIIFAIIGRVQPIIFATMTAQTIAAETTR